MIFSIEQQIEDWKRPVRVVSLQGHLESSTLPGLEETLSKYMAEEPWDWAIDLGYLEYISSAGIAALMKTKQTLESKGGGVCLFDPNDAVDQTFRLLEMHRYFKLYKQKADAKDKF